MEITHLVTAVISLCGTHTNTRAHTCTHTDTHRHTHTHTNTHRHTHTHIDTHTHTCTHTDTQRDCSHTAVMRIANSAHGAHETNFQEGTCKCCGSRFGVFM